MLLTQACPRENLKILAVNTDYRHKRHLENLSVMKGEDITCLYNRTGDIVIKVKDGRLAINREFASMIEVESLNPQNFEVVKKNQKLKLFIQKIPVLSRIKKIQRWISTEETRRVPTQEALLLFKKEDEEMSLQTKKRKQLLRDKKYSVKTASDKEDN